jgi:hypothetical protein
VILPGEPWGGPVSGPVSVSGGGGDADLADLVAANPGARIAFRPDASCDLARAVGLDGAGTGAMELPVDAIEVDDGTLAVNLVIAGVPPERLRWWRRRRPVSVRVDERMVFDGPATTVVIANGQFRAGADLIPRGHPGDGRLEVQVYAVGPGERRGLRARLATGSHVPHPAIASAGGRHVECVWARPAPLEVDGRRRGRRGRVEASVVPALFSLVV